MRIRRNDKPIHSKALGVDVVAMTLLRICFASSFKGVSNNQEVLISHINLAETNLVVGSNNNDSNSNSNNLINSSNHNSAT